VAKKPKTLKSKPEKDEFETTLEDMHVGLAKELLKRVKDGTASASDLNVARQFLKDNGIEGNPKKHTPLRELTNALPFAAEA
jgi:hypothetical protein